MRTPEAIRNNPELWNIMLEAPTFDKTITHVAMRKIRVQIV